MSELYKIIIYSLLINKFHMIIIRITKVYGVVQVDF